MYLCRFHISKMSQMYPFLTREFGDAGKFIPATHRKKQHAKTIDCTIQSN